MGVVFVRQPPHRPDRRMLPHGPEPVVRTEPEIVVSIFGTDPGDAGKQLFLFSGGIIAVQTVVGTHQQTAFPVFAEHFGNHERRLVQDLAGMDVQAVKHPRCPYPYPVAVRQDRNGHGPGSEVMRPEKGCDRSGIRTVEGNAFLRSDKKRIPMGNQGEYVALQQAGCRVHFGVIPI